MRKGIAVLLAVVELLFLGAVPAQAVIGGRDDGPAHPYVVLLYGEGVQCSGALISARVVVTAAHCFGDGATIAAYWDIDGSGFTGNGLDGFDGATYGTVHQYPGYVSEAAIVTNQNDLAVVVLDSDAVVPRYAQLPTVGLADSLGKSPAVTYAAYGSQYFAKVEPQSPPEATSDGRYVRQTATSNLITNSDTRFSKYLYLAAKQGVLLCFGDSGSPILRGDTILAVFSFLNGPRCAAQEHAFRIDNEAALAFIRSFL